MEESVDHLFVGSRPKGTTDYIRGIPWVGAVLDGLLAVLAPLVAVVEDLYSR